MASTGPSRLVYIFPAIAFGAVALYYLYGAVDRLGLETQRAEARVTAKQVARGSTTYNTRIAGGRAWSQATENPDAFIVSLEIEGEASGGAVDSQMYESLSEGDRVQVQFQRTRISRQILVTNVHR